MKTVAYLRVSTPQQDVSSQRLAILEYAQKHGLHIDDFIEATASGQASEKRRRLDELTSALQPGDRLVVSELSRLGRSLGQVVAVLDALAKAGVAFVALKENIRVAQAASSVARMFPERAVVLMSPDLAPTHIPTSLAYLHDVDAILVQRRNADGRVLRRVIGDWLARGRPVFLVVGREEFSFFAPDLALAAIGGTQIDLHTLETTRARVPRAAVRTPIPLRFFQVTGMIVAEREELTETGLGSTARCCGCRRHRQANSVRVCSPTSRRVASLRPRSAGLTALTSAPRTARPDWLLPTMPTHTPPTCCGRRPVQNDALSSDR